MIELQHFALHATQSRHFWNKKTSISKLPSLQNLGCTPVYGCVVWSRNADQQTRLFRFLKASCFCLFKTYSRLFGSQSRLQINFPSDYGPETKGTKKRYRTYLSVFRHDHRILKLLLICRGTRSVLMRRSSVYFCHPHFVCSGNGTRRIVILKTKQILAATRFLIF